MQTSRVSLRLDAIALEFGMDHHGANATVVDAR